MGRSRFRISHVMPHWWFYKVRDIDKTTDQRPFHPEDNTIALDFQRTISLPRSDYNKFATSQTISERFYASPTLNYSVASDICIPEEKKKQKEAIRIQSRRRINRAQGKSHPPSSTLVEARITAGCSCRTRITTGPYVRSNKKHIGLKKVSDVAKTQKLNSNCSRDFPGVFQRNHLQASEKRNKISADPYKSRVCYAPKSINTVEKATLYNVLKRDDSCDFEELKKEVYEVMEDPVWKRGYGRKCSAFCCSCRLSISSIEADAESLCDAGLSSEDDESEDSTIQVPFLNKCSDYNSLVLGMKLKCPPTVDDLKESAATLSRRRDDQGLNSHAQAQAKLGEMIRAKGHKKPINHHWYDHQTLMDHPRACRDGMDSVYFNKNKKGVLNSQELYGKSINYAESDPEQTPRNNSFSELFYQSKEQSPAAVNSDTEPEIKEVQPEPNPHHGKGNSVLNNRSKIDHGSPRLKRGYRRSAEQKAPVPSDAQRKISESFAIVKCSYDPRRDFRESMIEMIIKSGICESKDLQELVRCYISLNSDEYHPVILEVFEQIQSDLLGIHA